jgi:hypothetical protein
MIAAGKPLKHWSRGTTKTTEIVIHESVTRGRDTTLSVLADRGLSVHYTIERDGGVEQHAPLDRQCAHAGSPHNRRSVALEVINRYYGASAVEGELVIDAVWAHRKKYIVPTPEQLEATWGVVVEVLAACPDIPRSFPGVDGDTFRWARYPWATQPPKRPGGIVAHHRWDHADGLFPEHYCLMRSLGHSRAMAYQLTLDAARSGKRSTPVRSPAPGVA